MTKPKQINKLDQKLEGKVCAGFLTQDGKPMYCIGKNCMAWQDYENERGEIVGGYCLRLIGGK